MGAPMILKLNPGVHPLPVANPNTGSLYRVVIIDNDHNTYDEVISVCMQALRIGFDDAFKIALAVDHNGEAEIFRAPREEAERVAEIIRKIGIEVVVAPL
jgi:ATP-dependent Clp protease adapter protein ClpS